VLREFLNSQAALWSSCVERADDERQPSAPVFIGFSGLGGDVFAQSTLISLEPTRWSFLRAQLGRSLRRIEDAIPNDRWLDVIGGSAGFVLGCEQLLRLGVAPESTAAAARAQQVAATHLINMATDWGAGLAWKVPKEKVPLLGFAHGWAGIVAALASAGRRATSKAQQTAIESCLREAAAYPQTIFHTRRAWKDYREGSLGDESLNRNWCHGVPGFLRGMLEVQRYWTEEVHSELDSTIRQVRALASSDAYRFCCGEMGNLDFLLDYSRAAYTPEAEFETRSELLRMVVAILLFTNNGGKKNRQLPELSFPGLFKGQSGLAYCAARFILPDLPSLSGHHMPRVTC
jgi:lantibiotic modifying enzyme